MTKDYKEELFKFINFIKEGKNFAFVRLSDAEGHVLRNGEEFDDTRIGHNWDWQRDERHLKSRELLINASLCDDENFYVGLPTHGDKAFFDRMKSYTRQKEEFLTYAVLFMDSNYKYFISDMYPALQKREIVSVFSDKANLQSSGLNIIKNFGAAHSAYVNSLHLIDEMKKYIGDNRIKNKVFLVTAGVFANILIYELFKFEKENTYIDLGSALDVQLGLGATKHFLTNHPCINQYHHWYE
jgi:hypothetical protein